MKSVNLLFGRVRALSAAGYQISVTSVRGFLVKWSVRLLSTKMVVVTPTGKGPSWSGSVPSARAGGAAKNRTITRNVNAIRIDDSQVPKSVRVASEQVPLPVSKPAEGLPGASETSALRAV